MDNPVIVTIYGKDGTKIRRPVGFLGGQCNRATLPYEAREITGQVKKRETPEALAPEPGPAVEQQQKIGGE